MATEPNLNRMLEKLEVRMDANDVSVMYVLAHGDECGTLYFDMYNVWRFDEINDWLLRIPHKYSVLFLTHASTAC